MKPLNGEPPNSRASEQLLNCFSSIEVNSRDKNVIKLIGWVGMVWGDWRCLALSFRGISSWILE